MPKCAGRNWTVAKGTGTADFGWGWKWSVPSYLAYREARAIAEQALEATVLGEVVTVCDDGDGRPLCEAGCECKVTRSGMYPEIKYSPSGAVIGGGTWTYIALCFLGASCEEIVGTHS